jgi:hypothetical protein
MGIVGDRRIFKINNIVKEIMRINYYRRLSSLVVSYKVKAITYYFNSMEILMKDTNLGTIPTADKELYNLTAISVDIAIDLNAELR